MNFCDRMFDHDLNRRVLESMIKAGAFDRMGYRRSQLIQVYGQVLDGIAASRKRNVEGQLDLFSLGGGESQNPAPLPALHLPDLPEYSPQELMSMEKETTGSTSPATPWISTGTRWPDWGRPPSAPSWRTLPRRVGRSGLPTTSGSPSAAW